MSAFKDEVLQIKAAYDRGDCQRKRDELAARFRSKAVILYGAGSLGDYVKTHLAAYRVGVECFCDTYKTGTDKVSGLPIIMPDQLMRDYSDAIVIITSELHGASILGTLKQIGFAGEIFPFHELLGFYTLTYEEFAPHISGYEWAYDFFSDAQSKSIVLDRIKTYLLGSAMTPSHWPQYFDRDVCPLTDREIFADGGFFTGDTAEAFIRQTNGKYERVYGFEPDESNRKKAAANLAKYSNIEIVPGGLWSKTDTLRFVSGAYGSAALSGEGDVSVPVFALDVFFKEKTPPTFVKMDIEGAEKEALLGAQALIRAAKPKMAICVYHKPEDTYELPRLMYALNPGYTFALRHYSAWHAESVCYAR